MNDRESTALFNGLYPRYFEEESIRSLPEDIVFNEMILPLGKFDTSVYDRKLDNNISFGFYDGDINELRNAVGKVDADWTEYFDGGARVYCGYVDGEIASFCIADDMGELCIDGKTYKIGGPGCIGTIPVYRNKGIALTMVKMVTQYLKEEGYDYSYIHYTAVAPWYEKLGYETIIKWNAKGIIR